MLTMCERLRYNKILVWKKVISVSGWESEFNTSKCTLQRTYEEICVFRYGMHFSALFIHIMLLCRLLFSSFSTVSIDGSSTLCLSFSLQRMDCLWGGRDQATEKLTKDSVRRRSKTLSLPRFDNSCVRNALLEMVNVALNRNWVIPLR
jgi:hypothetical protein